MPVRRPSPPAHETLEQFIARVNRSAHVIGIPTMENRSMKTLKQFQFTSVSDRAIYDWDTILDGKIRQLDKGPDGDYDCEDTTFATLARNSAKARNLSVKTSKVEGGMVVQAIEATPEQIEAWEAQAAAAKEKARQKRAEKSAAKRAANGAE